MTRDAKGPRAAAAAEVVQLLLAANATDARTRDGRTALGFARKHRLPAAIVDALQAALTAHREQPLDVVLVHYGSTVRSEWAGIGVG